MSKRPSVPDLVEAIWDLASRGELAHARMVGSSTLRSITAEVLMVLDHPEAFVSDETEVTMCCDTGCHEESEQLGKLRRAFDVHVEAKDTFGEFVKRVYDVRHAGKA